MAIKDIYKAVLDYNLKEIANLVQKEIKNGTDASAILNEGLIAPMDEIGDLFSSGQIFVPEMLVAAMVMQSGLDSLKPNLLKKDTESKGTIVIGTVKGDMHDIGKNIVKLMLEGAGFDIVDLGVDVDSERFIEAAQKHNAFAVALSALLTVTMPTMENTVSVIRSKLPKVKIMIGGAPITQEFADKISADGYAADAGAAVKLAKKIRE